ncbi:Nucleoside diphosphate kinase 6 [Smittium culicis]|uniref:Nucleoside diphosphate kinase n=1 Tax=Smittium culicis TaxID=133412 RepID=A0A1R1X5G9_9FUNG|nr:Nucleoside diphosphate kinase 6 [Smittium culicis]
MYMTSGEFVALVIRGEQAISKWRRLIGKTHPVRAKVDGTFSLRSKFGLTDTRNSFHGSDSNENARVEINKLFPGFFS